MTIRYLVILVLLSAAWAHGEIAVIVHPANKNAVDTEELNRLFLGKKASYADNSAATVYYLVETDPVRGQFDEKGLGKSSAQLKAYWSKLVFTGKGTPPAELASSTEALAKVAGDPTAIAYVDKSVVTDKVKVVASFP